MNLIDESALSCYEDIHEINKEHHVTLVKHTGNDKVFVKKSCLAYSLPMLSSLREHPVRGMPRIFELFETDGKLIIIEEYISGDTLEELLCEHGPFSEKEVVPWMLELCRVVGDLHSFDPPVIHRDIKPSNIMITPDGTLKLLDLSAARQSSEIKSQDTVMIGTAGYAAPEQYGFSTSSRATDIYAIGVVMNRLLTGKMLNEERYPGGLSSIIQTCTKLNPEERYQTAQELKQALEDYISKTTEPKAAGDATSGTQKANSSHTQEEDSAASRHNWKYFLPPGFRSGNPVLMVFAILGYFLLFYFSLTVSSTKTGWYPLFINRVIVTVMFLAVVLFTGNYLNVQSKLLLSRSSNPVIRIIGILLWDGIIVILLACLAVILGA